MDTSLADSELLFYHKQIKSNVVISLIDAIDDNPLFIVENNDDAIKIIPLFYCDAIASSNVNDNVLENKCIICENREDTYLNFLTNKGTEDIGVFYNRYAFYIPGVVTKVYFRGVVYDKLNYTPLSNAAVQIKATYIHNVIKEYEVVTDEFGEFAIIDENRSKIEHLKVTVYYNGTTKVFEDLVL